MKTILGFISKGGFINNEEREVREFYELSPLAATYTRSIGEYRHANYPNSALHTFKTVEDGEFYSLDPAQVAEIMAVDKAMNDYMEQNAYPYNMTDFALSITAALNGAVKDVELAELIGSMVLPTWFTYTSVTFPDTRVKIWVSSKIFQAQYSDYEIVVIPPITEISRFFATYGTTVVDVKAVTAIDMMNKAQEESDELPPTVMRVLPVEYVNPSNPSQTTTSYWGILIYGVAGDHIDAIKDAVADYLMDNSEYGQDEWKTVLPSVFQRTEFLMQPRWDLISIPNLTVASALYRSMVSPSECIRKAIEVWPAIPASYVENWLITLPFDYKALTVMALAGQSNVNGKTALEALFPDYIPVSTGSLDFNRMSQATRNWTLMMVELLITAETMTDLSAIPNTMRRIKRNGKTYVGRIYNDVNYLVAARLAS